MKKNSKVLKPKKSDGVSNLRYKIMTKLIYNS